MILVTAVILMYSQFKLEAITCIILIFFIPNGDVVSYHIHLFL